MIFSHVLYQLSYLGTDAILESRPLVVKTLYSFSTLMTLPLLPPLKITDHLQGGAIA